MNLLYGKTDPAEKGDGDSMKVQEEDGNIMGPRRDSFGSDADFNAQY